MGSLIIVNTLDLFDVSSASEVSTNACKPYFIGRACDEIPKQECLNPFPKYTCPLDAAN